MHKLNKIIKECREGKREDWELVEFILNARNTKYKVRQYNSAKANRIRAHNAAIHQFQLNHLFSPNLISHNGYIFPAKINNSTLVDGLRGSTRTYKGTPLIHWEKYFHSKLNDYVVVGTIAEIFCKIEALRSNNNRYHPTNIFAVLFTSLLRVNLLKKIKMDHNEQYLFDLLWNCIMEILVPQFLETISVYLNQQLYYQFNYYDQELFDVAMFSIFTMLKPYVCFDENVVNTLMLIRLTRGLCAIDDDPKFRKTLEHRLKHV